MQFEHKQFIWLLLAAGFLVLLFLIYLQWKRKTKKRLGDAKLIDLLTGPVSKIIPLFKFILLITAFALGVISVMNPRKPGESLVSRKGIDLAIALDVSNSMLATDLAPNRLERAKQFISKLMSAMPDDRVSLVLFAGKAYLQMPLTVDHGAAGLFVNTASPAAIPEQGTVIADALEKAAYSLSGAETKFKSVILITDGEDHDESAVSMAKKLSTQGVMVNAIGVGSPEGSAIPDPATGDVKRDESGNPVQSRLNESVLQEIASATNGVYSKLESSDAAVSLIKEQLSQIERKAFTDFSQVNFKTYYGWAAALMLLFLILDILIPETAFLKARKKQPVTT